MARGPAHKSNVGPATGEAVGAGVPVGGGEGVGDSRAGLATGASVAEEVASGDGDSAPGLDLDAGSRTQAESTTEESR